MPVDQLFALLNDRIFSFENRKDKYPEPLDPGTYILMMEYIGIKVANFSPEQSFPLIKRYKKRVESLLKEVLEETPDNIKNIQRPVVWEEVDENDDPNNMKVFPNEVLFLEEIEFYDSQLTLLFKTWETLDSFESSIIKPLQLPENYHVKLKQRLFASELSPSQTELFLYFLKKHKIIGGFSANDLGKIAGMLFGKSPQETRAHITKIYPDDPKPKLDLEKIKSLTEMLLEDIDNELIKAR